MGSPADRIFREVLALPAEERENLFRRLKDALPRSSDESDDATEPQAEVVRAAWVELALARLEKYERGESGPTKSIDEVERLLTESLRES